MIQSRKENANVISYVVKYCCFMYVCYSVIYI